MKRGIEMEIREAIERRKSVRKYQDVKLPQDTYSWLKETLQEINTRNQEKVRMVLVEEKGVKDSKIGFLMGAVKINAPYEVVLVGRKGERLLAGYEGERLVLGLTQREVGTCWLGTYAREVLHNICQVTEEEEIFCVIALGVPYDKSFLNQTFRKMIGCHKRKPLEEIVMENGENTLHALKDGKKIQEAIEEAIKAPSANNVQPWRVEVKGTGLEIFYKQPYALDGGIFLAHLLGMLHEMKISYEWVKEACEAEEWVRSGRINFI